MSEREHLRMPYAVQVEFRTASSFLIAYSVNLSRGGLFLETEQDIPQGAAIGLALDVPGTGPLDLTGVVAWRRAGDSPDGPPGLGIELQDVAPALGSVIDQLVARFHGIQILLLSGDKQDRTTLARLIKSIVATAEVVQAVDLLVVDLDFETEQAFDAMRAARALSPRIPIVAITQNAALRDQARSEGADETAPNPPAFIDLQLVLVRALSRPLRVAPIPIL
jgi:uncharacterized protein (TIGR02266 family)